MTIYGVYLTLSNINPRSIDVTFTQTVPNLNFKIKNKKSEISIIIPKDNIVENSINPSPNNKVIMIDKSTLLYPGNYTLETFSGTELLAENDFTVEEFPIDQKPTVTGLGTRIIKVSFLYPITNIDAVETITDGSTTKYVLSNFYMKLFNQDTNNSLTEKPEWGGFFTVVDKNSSDDPDTAPFKIDVSSDEKTLLIQSNEKSLPIGDNHTLKIGYVKNFNKPLSGPLGREIPSSEEVFRLDSAISRGNVISIEAISQNSIVVTFDRDVCHLNNEAANCTIDKVSTVTRAASPVQFEIVERVVGEYNKLKFTLPSNSFFTPGTRTFNISSITDAYGLQTNPYNTNLEITNIPIVLESVEQIVDSSIVNTLIKGVFSEELNEASAKDTKNYVLTNKLDTTKSFDLDKIEFVTNNHSVILIYTLQELPTGEYTLTTNGLKDIYGADVTSTSKDFFVKDLSRPKIEAILVASDGATPTPSITSPILIQFDESMTTGSLNGIDNLANYKIYDGLNFVDFTNANITLFNDDKWIRLSLDPQISLDLTNSKISIGYADISDIKYVTNKSGNVLDFCPTNTITGTVEPLDLYGGTASIINENTISYTLPTNNANNALETISNPTDFIFTQDSIKFTADEIELSDNHDILTFKFTNKTFTAADTNVKLNINPDLEITALDIFLNKITISQEIEITNNLGPDVLSVSNLASNIDIDSTDVVIALLYPVEITFVDKKDFIVTTNNNPMFINDAKIYTIDGSSNSSGQVIELSCSILSTVNTSLDDIYVSTVAKENIRTGSNKKKINSFSNMKANKFIAKDLDVTKPEASNLNGFEFKITFDDLINKDFLGELPSKASYTFDTKTTDDHYIAKLDFKIGYLNIVTTQDISSITAITDASITMSISDKTLIVTNSTDNINLETDKIQLYEFVPFGYKLVNTNFTVVNDTDTPSAK